MAWKFIKYLSKLLLLSEHILENVMILKILLTLEIDNNIDILLELIESYNNKFYTLAWLHSEVLLRYLIRGILCRIESIFLEWYQLRS